MTKRRKRTVRKLVLPLIAVGLMTLMMATHRGSAAPAPAAQLPQAALGH
jgi:hypothetical protein